MQQAQENKSLEERKKDFHEKAKLIQHRNRFASWRADDKERPEAQESITQANALGATEVPSSGKKELGPLGKLTQGAEVTALIGIGATGYTVYQVGKWTIKGATKFGLLNLRAYTKAAEYILGDDTFSKNVTKAYKATGEKIEGLFDKEKRGKRRNQ